MIVVMHFGVMRSSSNFWEFPLTFACTVVQSNRYGSRIGTSGTFAGHIELIVAELLFQTDHLRGVESCGAIFSDNIIPRICDTVVFRCEVGML